MKKLVLLVIILISDAHALSTFIPAGGVLRAQFTQQRHITGVPKPLHSQGTLLIWSGNGLIWRTTKPFPSAILINKRGLHQINGSQKTAIIQANQENAIFNVIAGVLSGGVIDEVEGFQVEEDGDQIRLVPQHDEIKNFIESIVIEGKKYITHIVIYRPNGDSDDIYLDNHKLGQKLNPQEKAWFND